jgi:hypothetical protein
MHEALDPHYSASYFVLLDSAYKDVFIKRKRSIDWCVIDGNISVAPFVYDLLFNTYSTVSKAVPFFSKLI